MHYALLLVSETQGVGKTTLAEKILAPLIGVHNVSFPNEKQVTDSKFTSWLVHKRLAVVNEIYAGEKRKAYDNVKSYITEVDIDVEEKFQKPYKIRNHTHILATSNSLKALKLDIGDRRWLVPGVTEELRPQAYWSQYNEWLRGDGLSYIAAWAREFVTTHGAVETGAHAPWTRAKQEMIEENMSPGMMLVAKVLDNIKDNINGGKPAMVLDCDLVDLIRTKLWEGRFNDRLEKPLTIRKLAKSKGWFVAKEDARVLEWNTRHRKARMICSSRSMANRPATELHEEGVMPIQLDDVFPY
jgi:hypothetical protein